LWFMRGKLSWEESFSPHPFQRTFKFGFEIYFLLWLLDVDEIKFHYFSGRRGRRPLQFNTLFYCANYIFLYIIKNNMHNR